MNDTVLLDRPEAGIALVTLNRPTRANAMNQPMLARLAEVCAELDADETLRVVVVTGAGAAFTSGFDLKDQAAAMPTGVKEWVPLLEADFAGIMAFWNLSKPSVAAVNGPALAGGFELMMSCDLAIAAETAVFGEPELKFGAGIVAMMLPWYVTPKVAKDIILTGEDHITAKQALAWGLVNEVVAAGEVMDRAMAKARVLANMDPMVMSRTRMALNRTYEIMGMQRALRAALDIDIMIEGEGAPLKRDFLRRVQSDGLGAALKWRDARTSGQGA